MMRGVFLFCSLWLATGWAPLGAQVPDSLSDASAEVFIDELNEFLNAGKRRQAEDITERFEERFPLYTESQQAAIMSLSNEMLRRGMPAAPHFEQYLRTLFRVPYAESAGEARFAEWDTAVVELLASLPNKQFKGYLDFLEFSENFYRDQALETSGGVTWYARSEAYELTVESGEAILHFDTLNLVALRRGDSMTIQRTAGDYFTGHHNFEGAGGKVYWDKLGLADCSVFLQDYSIDLTSGQYEADSVRLTYPEFFADKRIYGTFADKITSTKPGAASVTYPRFQSYDNELVLADLGKGLTYTGGFRLEGRTVYGDAPKGLFARLELQNEVGKTVFLGLARQFTIKRSDRILGYQVRTTFYYGTDSIAHPSAELRYDIADQVLTLTRGERASDRTPFYSSYQNVNIGAEELKVYVARDSVLFGERKQAIGKASEAMEIESLDYFSARDYNRYQSISTYNPLSVIRAVAEREGRVIDGESLARKLDPKFKLDNIKTLLFDLASNGFIDFDLPTGRITVKDKIFHFVEASQGKRDYDAMRIKSKTKETNASLDLKSKQMLVNGVRQLELSRNQRVAILPLGGQLVVREDRGIDFDGLLYAGNTTFEGKDMHFEYDPYQIVLDSVRYFDMYAPEDVEEGEEQGEPLAIASRIEHLKGVVLVDAPSNKSGKDDIAIFPSLQTTGPSYIYYRGGTIDPLANVRLDSNLLQDSFYFELDEFSINGLDRFSVKDLRFTGRMHTASVFEDYRADIYLREDRSFGHVAETGQSGWEAYRGKGNFTGEVDLGNSGMNAKGQLDYLTASVSADDFVFEAGRVTGTAESFDLAEDRAEPLITPEAHGKDVHIEWVPYRDSLYLSSAEEPFDLFGAEGHTLEGRLVLTPDGLKAQGVHDSPEVTLRSEMINYGAFSAQSDSMIVAIKTGSGSEVALEAENVSGEIDWDESSGEFRARDEFLTVDLPANKYRTSMKSFTWDIGKQSILFETEAGKPGDFHSLDPAQDSLNFQGQAASYNLAGTKLDIGGVPYIATADALIYIPDGNVSVEPSGKLTTLTGARIEADTVTKYHIIDSATVDILGRKDYTAKGYYRYDVAGRSQQVFLGDIVGQRVGKGSASEKAAVTRASGEIEEAQKFYIDDRTLFQGIFSFDASRPEIQLDGFAKLDAPGLPEVSYFSVVTPGDKDDLRIKYDLPLSPDGDRLATGVFLDNASPQAYPRLLTPTYTGMDRPLLDLSEGMLDYDPEADVFIAGDTLRVVGDGERGGLMRVDAKTGEYTANGPLEIGSALDYTSVKASGNLRGGFVKSEGIVGDPAAYPDTEVEAIVSIDMIMPEKLLNLLAADIQASGFNTQDVRYIDDAKYYRESLPNWLNDPQDSTTLVAVKRGAFVLPEGESGHAFVFPKLGLTYDGDYKSFFSNQDKVDVAYIGNNAVHKKLNVYVEAKMPGNGDDRLYVYVKSPSDAWYYFGYKQGILEIASSSPRFNEALDGLKKKELYYKMDDDEYYEIAVGGAGTVNAFVNRVKAALSGE